MSEISPTLSEALTRALALHQAGELAQAAQIYRKIIDVKPNHADALHMLGVLHYQCGHHEEGDRLINQAIALKPDYAEAYYNQGNALWDRQRLDQAVASYDKAIALKPNYAEAYYNRGNALRDLKRLDQALASYDRAIALNPNYAEAYNNRGVMLQELKRLDEALASFDKTIALKPDYAEAYYNRGTALRDLKRLDQALASYDKAIALKPNYAEAHNNRGVMLQDLKRLDEALDSYDRAIALKLDYAEAFNNRGNALQDLKRFDEALTCYDRAITLKPDYAEAYSNKGNALRDLRRLDQALACYDKAIALKPNHAAAHNNRGSALHYLKRFDDAVASYDAAIAQRPDYAEAYYNRGNALQDLKRLEEAAANYDKAFTFNPDCEFVLGAWIKTKMAICEWGDLDTNIAQLVAKIEHGEKVTTPWLVLSASSSPELQRRAAEILIHAKAPSNNVLSKIVRRQRRDRIHIGYFSADFRNHATSYLMAELFEKHHGSQFEVTAFYLGADEKDEMRDRLTKAFSAFLDVRNQSDKEIAVLARKLGIDIAVDLNGFTTDARTGIFAFRAAPIQINYLGFPGTMGAEYIDYLIADPTLIPSSEQKYYSEKIAYLPDSYQVNDTKRHIADKVFAHAELGLPQHGFIFCCFNNNHKITPDVFDCWMRIIKQVDGSVLWLLEDNKTAAFNLRKEAVRRGVDADRLVFASRMPLSEHLARHRLADLFLDTLPCNAHTTASDALWAGLPILTRIGETFAGRVASSLLNAIGLPELITSTPQAYETLAIELATNSDRLAHIKRKLAKNRLETPLFDIQRFTRNIEAAYFAMYERYQSDLPPDHIYVRQ
jgi:protein O-GlcNAc transferase